MTNTTEPTRLSDAQLRECLDVLMECIGGSLSIATIRKIRQHIDALQADLKAAEAENEQLRDFMDEVNGSVGAFGYRTMNRPDVYSAAQRECVQEVVESLKRINALLNGDDA